MFIEQYKYIRSYFRIAVVNPFLFALNILTAALYKAADVARPFVASLIVKALTDQNVQGAFFAIAAYTAIYFFFRGMLFLNWRAYSWNLIYCYHGMQDKIFNKLLSVDHNFARRINRGRLMNVINSDLFDIGGMNDDISELLTTVVQIIGVIIISATHSIAVTILMVASVIIASKIRTVHDRKFNFFWWKSQTCNDQYSDFLNQILTGLQEVKVFNMLPSLHQHLDKIQRNYDRNYAAQRHHLAVRDNDVGYVVYASRALILLICVLLMAAGHMELDILVMLYTYHQQLINIARDLTDSTIDIRLNNAAVRRVASILNYKSEKKTEFGNLDLDNISGSIQFKNVSLTINHHHILKNINLKIRPHEFVAIVGYPGSGKTKLLDLILRINQPTRGKITLDNININDFSKDIYASNVSVANQVPFIFNTSIRKNLNFVDTNIKHQIEACKIAGIHDFIENLPLGYNTILRENGNNISGGQRQMISIARTILTDAEVLLLDDITTSLDPDTAKLVPRLIDRIKSNRTIIMITKKPELMREADRIVVLDKGKISAVGTHKTLMEKSKLYRSLQALQSTSPNGEDL